MEEPTCLPNTIAKSYCNLYTKDNKLFLFNQEQCVFSINAVADSDTYFNLCDFTHKKVHSHKYSTSENTPIGNTHSGKLHQLNNNYCNLYSENTTMNLFGKEQCLSAVCALMDYDICYNLYTDVGNKGIWSDNH